ncbi:hypothetical protein [Solibacillus merdavium]|uniref:Uncharacterized protein n=1 Tax=Solibacillus merdavium TaxID=2762218 RepID=A0ABR8XQF2_9BACL|nr:hypothetical protein [Solibacillus merdavium]MBD8034163.1 hypothetical protein [Solibacillus merdavium]
MDTKQLNEEFYSKRALVGTINHCICGDCVFYAAKIMNNYPLVEFLHSKGLDPRKADEVWAYLEKGGYKYYTVDFFEVYADIEESHTFENAKVTIRYNIYAEKKTPTYTCTIDVIFKI